MTSWQRVTPGLVRLLFAILVGSQCWAQDQMVPAPSSNGRPSTPNGYSSARDGKHSLVPGPARSERRIELDSQAARARRPTPDQLYALDLLASINDTGRHSSDFYTKAIIQANAADALWPYARELSVQWFKNALQGLEDVESDRQDMKPALLDADKRYVFQARAEIIRLVSHHDANLAKSLMKSIEANGKPRDLAGTPDGAGSQGTFGLQAARSLIDTNPDASARILRTILSSGIDPLAVGVMKGLRDANPILADGLFDQALAIAARDQAGLGANLLILSAYLAPGDSRSPSGFAGSETGQTNIAGAQRFLNFAYSAIMYSIDQWLAVDGTSPASSLLLADNDMLSTAVRLLPLFDLYVPGEAETIRARLEAIAPTLPEGVLRDGILAGIRIQSPSDLELSAQAAGDSPLRDSLYTRTAELAASAGHFDQALDITQKVASEPVRENLAARVSLWAATDAVKANELDTAYRWASQLTSIIDRARVFSSIAIAALKGGDSIRAVQMVDDAEQQILRAEDPMTRAWALTDVSEAAFAADQYRGVDITREAIKALNRIDPCAGLPRKCDPLRSKRALIAQIELRFCPALARLAESDFQGAILLATSIQDKETSMLALLAACRRVLAPSLVELPSQKPGPRAQSRWESSGRGLFGRLGEG